MVTAWRWLAEYRRGVAAELAGAEAYAPLRHFATALPVIFGTPALAPDAAFVLSALRREERRRGPTGSRARSRRAPWPYVHCAGRAPLEPPTAVKSLEQRLAGDALIARFEREATLASRLEHPASAELFDNGC